MKDHKNGGDIKQTSFCYIKNKLTDDDWDYIKPIEELITRDKNNKEYDISKYYLQYPELFDFLKVFKAGIKQGHKPDGWLEPDGVKMSNKDNYASINRHVSKSLSGIKLDSDSRVDHRLHAAWRLLTSYLRDKRGIKHIDDKWALNDEKCLTIDEARSKYKNSQYSKPEDLDDKNNN